MQLKRRHRVRLTIADPFDFPRTVAKPAGWHWSTPEETFQDGTLWSGLYVGNRPVGLRMSATGNDVETLVYASSSLTGQELSTLHSVLFHGLGGEEDLAGFYRFARDDPILSTSIDDLYGMRLGTLDDVFGRTTLAILLQMAPMTRSDTMIRALLHHYGSPIQFDEKEVVLWPRPADLAGVDPKDLQKKANLGYRATRLVGAARYLVDHPLSIRDLVMLPEQEAINRLMGIYGVGEYSAGIILGRSSLPLDVWSVVIMSELFLQHTPENPRQEIDAVVETLSLRWGTWKWFAFVYVMNDLENLSRIYPLSRIH